MGSAPFSAPDHKILLLEKGEVMETNITQEIIDRLEKVTTKTNSGNFISLKNSRLDFEVKYQILNCELGKKTITLMEEGESKKRRGKFIKREDGSYLLYIDEFRYSLRF